MAKTRFVSTVLLKGVRWRIYFSEQSIGFYGKTIPSSNKIIIYLQPKHELEGTLIHEIVHAAYYSNRTDQVITSLLYCADMNAVDKVVHSINEIYTYELEPVLTDYIVKYHKKVMAKLYKLNKRRRGV